MEPVFTDARLEQIRQARDADPEVTHLVTRGDVTFALRADKDAVLVAVQGGDVRVDRVGSDASGARATLSAEPDSWSRFFERRGGLAFHSLFQMIMGGSTSEGLLESPLEVDDPLVVFAYAPLITALLEAARDPKEVTV